MSLCVMEKVVIVEVGEGASEVSSGGEARSPAGMGEGERQIWSCWTESRGMVPGMPHCLLNPLTLSVQ